MKRTPKARVPAPDVSGDFTPPEPSAPVSVLGEPGAIDTTVTLLETCSCGATITYRGSAPHIAAEGFRYAHKHERPERNVGRCTESLTSTIYSMNRPDAPPEHHVTTCSLDEGHTGAHQNDETGASWVLTSSTVQVPREAVDALLDWAAEVGHMTGRDEINSAIVWEKLAAFRAAIAPEYPAAKTKPESPA